MKLGQELRYLSSADIEGLEIGIEDIVRAIEAMFLDKASGRASMKPKLGLHAPSGTAFLASAGMLATPAYAGIKWVGVANSEQTGLPHIAGTILLSDNENGMPLSVMDARWVTGVRTAAITAVAAKYLAKRDSRSIGFIACGLQARTHLDALRSIFDIEQIQTYSRRLSSAQKFAQEASEGGIRAQAFSEPRAAVEGWILSSPRRRLCPRLRHF